MWRVLSLLCFTIFTQCQGNSPPTVSPPSFTPLPDICSTTNCKTTCAKPTSSAQCNQATGAWEVLGDLLLSAITSPVNCLLVVSGNVKAISGSTQGNTVNFGPCGRIDVKQTLELANTDVQIDLGAWSSRIPMSDPTTSVTLRVFSYTCVTGIIGSWGFPSFPVTSTKNICWEILGSSTDYYFVFKDNTAGNNACVTYDPPPRCTLNCGNNVCSAPSVCPNLFGASAECLPTGEWQYNGGGAFVFPAGQTPAPKIDCRYKFPGDLTINSPLTFGGCGLLDAAGTVSVGNGVVGTYDFTTQGVVLPGFRKSIIKFSSMTNNFPFQFSNIMNSPHTASNISTQKTDVSLDVVTSDTFIDPDVSTSTGTGMIDCGVSNCNTPNFCPQPLPGAVCLSTGEWSVDTAFSTSQFTVSQISCKVKTAGSITLTGDLTFKICGQLISGQTAKIQSGTTVTYKLSPLRPVNPETRLTFLRYPEASGLISGWGVDGGNYQQRNMYFAPQKTNNNYDIYFYVGDTVPKHDVSTNSPAAPNFDCSSINCRNTASPFPGAACQTAGEWLINGPLAISGTTQIIGSLVKVNGPITVADGTSLNFGVCGLLQSLSTVTFGTGITLLADLGGNTVQDGSIYKFIGYSSGEGSIQFLKTENLTKAATIGLIHQKRNTEYVVLGYDTSKPAPAYDISSTDCSKFSCQNTVSPFPGATCQPTGAWYINGPLAISGATAIIKSPVDVNGAITVNNGATLNFGVCGLLQTTSTVSFGTDVTISADLGGATVQDGSTFKFISYASATGIIKSVNTDKVVYAPGPALSIVAQKKSTEYVIIFFDSTKPAPPFDVSTNSPTTNNNGNPTNTGNPGTTANPTNPTGSSGNPTGSSGNPTGSTGNPTGNSGNPTGSSGNPTGSSGNPTGSSGNPTGSSGNPTGSSGNPTGNPTATTGRPTGTTGNPTGGSGNNVNGGNDLLNGGGEVGGFPWWGILLIVLAVIIIVVIVIVVICCCCGKKTEEKV